MKASSLDSSAASITPTKPSAPPTTIPVTCVRSEGRAAEATEWLEKAALAGTPAVRAAVLELIARHAHCDAMLNLQVRLLRDCTSAISAEGG